MIDFCLRDEIPSRTTSNSTKNVTLVCARTCVRRVPVASNLMSVTHFLWQEVVDDFQYPSVIERPDLTSNGLPRYIQYVTKYSIFEDFICCFIAFPTAVEPQVLQHIPLIVSKCSYTFSQTIFSFISIYCYEQTANLFLNNDSPHVYQFCPLYRWLKVMFFLPLLWGT